MCDNVWGDEMSTSTRWVRIRSWCFLTVRRGFSSGRVRMSATSLLVALHVVKLTALQAVTSLRGRKTLQEEVPHLHLSEVQVGNNALQLY